MENINNDDYRYLQAKKRVQQVKGFYVHALVYFLVNAGLLFLFNSNINHDFGNINTYFSALFWGIGLIAHGLSVFLPNMILGRNWEEKKIRELMDKNK